MKTIAHLHFFLLVLFLVMAEDNQKTVDQQNESESSSGPKIKWAEVVGLTVEEAQNKIKEDMPMVQFQVVPPDHFVTMDYQPRRVRLYLDSSHKVARPPTIG